jgi:hypothetical protein
MLENQNQKSKQDLHYKKKNKDMEKQTKQLEDILKVFVNARGITNGELEVNAIEYVIGSDIDKLIEFINNNGLNFDNILNQIKTQLDTIQINTSLGLDTITDIVNSIVLGVIQNELLIKDSKLSIDEIKSSIVGLNGKIINISTQITNTNTNINNKIDNTNTNINNKIDNTSSQIRNLVSTQANRINKTLLEISDKVEPKTIIKKEVEYRDRYIEVQTTKYVYVEKKDQVRPSQVVKIDRGNVNPKQYEMKDTSWKPFFDRWLYKENNNTFYFKLDTQADSEMTRLGEFIDRYGKGELGVKLMEMGLIPKQKAVEKGIVYTNAWAPEGATKGKWKNNISSW